jgi:hypothetical protein
VTGPGPLLPPDVRAVTRAAMRRATLQLVIGVAALDGVAMAIYFLADISHGPPRTRMIFTVVWTITTALVVAFLLKRVRRARFVTMR